MQLKVVTTNWSRREMVFGSKFRFRLESGFVAWLCAINLEGRRGLRIIYNYTGIERKLNEASVLFDEMRVRFPMCILNSRGFCGYSAIVYESVWEENAAIPFHSSSWVNTLYNLLWFRGVSSAVRGRQLLTKRFPHETHTSQIHNSSICISTSASASPYPYAITRIALPQRSVVKPTQNSDNL